MSIKRQRVYSPVNLLCMETLEPPSLHLSLHSTLSRDIKNEAPAADSREALFMRRVTSELMLHDDADVPDVWTKALRVQPDLLSKTLETATNILYEYLSIVDNISVVFLDCMVLACVHNFVARSPKPLKPHDMKLACTIGLAVGLSQYDDAVDVLVRVAASKADFLQTRNDIMRHYLPPKAAAATDKLFRLELEEHAVATVKYLQPLVAAHRALEPSPTTSLMVDIAVGCLVFCMSHSMQNIPRGTSFACMMEFAAACTCAARKIPMEVALECVPILGLGELAKVDDLKRKVRIHAKRASHTLLLNSHTMNTFLTHIARMLEEPFDLYLLRITHSASLA